ncbi:MAG: Adenylosuccinate synthetase [Candidatus Magasanikbacteria bacterium GW2011_GWA2_45_39]|uniref:Adenylosuccinate synthetase n=1 Tax=Candidatus Magasanikbacteria bacterium GW2011_GWA2_45_39 TaxID=1619041 RepID=A0A0G1MDF3_9BACT|nr:MAG: Adenylosuccinate synthetase [Candidatus Magasanikbacteria bacterium GW2011_GWA2_45_39]
MDLVQIRQAVRCSGLTEIAVTKLDVLSGLDKIYICNSYDINGETVSEMPASLTKMRMAKPIYQEFSGWPEFGAPQNYHELPAGIKKYLEFVEKEVGCPIRIISFGPDRLQTLEKRVVHWVGQ